eukprot:SAG31_NODE_7567_length_1652_cov_1.614295_2_plen_221_part_00
MANPAAAKRVLTAQGSRIGLRSAGAGFLLSCVGLLGRGLGTLTDVAVGDAPAVVSGIGISMMVAMVFAPVALPPLMAAGWLGGRLTGWLVGAAAAATLRTSGARWYKSALWPDRAAERMLRPLQLTAAAAAAAVGFCAPHAGDGDDTAVWQQVDPDGDAGLAGSNFRWVGRWHSDWSGNLPLDGQPQGEWRRDDHLPPQRSDNVRQKVVISEAPADPASR